MSVRRLSKTFISGAGAAAEKSSNFLAGYSPAIDEMDLIERITVGAGGTSSIEFDQIPQTYRSLQLRIGSRCDYAGTGSGLEYYARFNDDTGNNYGYAHLRGSGTGMAAQKYASVNWILFGYGSRTADTANVFGFSITDIYNYSDITKNTITRSFAGDDNSGYGFIQIDSGVWMNTAAVNKITLVEYNSNFLQHSTASLYGVK